MGARADRLHVRAGIRLGHCHCSNFLSGNNVRKKLLDLLSRTRIDQMRGSHVGMHQHRYRKPAEARAAQFLREQRRRPRIQRRAAEFLRIAQAEEAEASHLPQHLARHEALLLPRRRLRHDLLLHVAPHAFAQHPEGVVVLFVGAHDVKILRQWRTRTKGRRYMSSVDAPVSKPAAKGTSPSGVVGLFGLFAGLCAIFGLLVTLYEWRDDTARAAWPEASALIEQGYVDAVRPRNGGFQTWQLRYRVRYEAPGEERHPTLTSHTTTSHDDAAGMHGSAPPGRSGRTGSSPCRSESFSPRRACCSRFPGRA